MPPVSALYRVEPETKVALADQDPADAGEYQDADEARAELTRVSKRIADLQARLYAEEDRSVLVVLQGIDAAGKGMIHVFNRSHYEDVLVVRVKGLVEEKRWRSRFDSINDFERMLVREGTTIVKFFLHISKDAQMDRFRERLEREDKHYKFSANDVRERRSWDAYQQAHEDALRHTSTEWAPWYMVPSDHKWLRNLVVAQTVADVPEEMDPTWPEPEEDLERFAAEEFDQLSSR
jgi:polyphosphate kinase 2 (PPK2 family)